MKKKRIVAIIMTLALSISIVGCGSTDKKDNKENVTKTETSKKQEDKKDIIEPTKENLLALGKKQTQDIKKIVEKYGITTEPIKVEEVLNAQIQVSKDETNINQRESSKGYELRTGNEVTINDGRQNKYDISYVSSYDDISQSGGHSCSIAITSSLDEFKIEQAKMLKELILTLHDGNYDFNGFDEWVNNGIRVKLNPDGTTNKGFNKAERDIRKYHEIVSDAIVGDKNAQVIIFTFLLRK